MLVFFAGMGGVLLTASVFLQAGQGFSALHTGIVFIPMSLGMAVGAGVSGAVLAKRLGRLAIQLGGAVTLTGWLLVVWAVASGGTVGALDLLPGLAVGGLGMGITVAPLFDLILASVTDEETGSASGLLNTLQQLASSFGVAVLGTVFFGAVTAHGFDGAFQRSLWLQVGSLVVMLLVTPILPRWPRETVDPVAVEMVPAAS
jgi:MFS family permease